MKRNLILCFCVIAFLPLFSQAEQPLEFSKVVQAEGKSADEIYSSVKVWIAENYRSAQDIIQLDDKQGGIIVLKAAHQFNYSTMSAPSFPGPIHYTLKISIKDGRFKVDMDKIYHESTTGPLHYRDGWSLKSLTSREKFKSGVMYGHYNKAWKRAKEDIELNFNSITIALAVAANNKRAEQNDNW